MKPNLKQLSVISLALVLLVGFTFATVARPRAELESLATSEAVPGLVQEAAVEALAEVYVKSDLSLKKLESIAKGDRAGLRKAAVPALVEKYGDVSNINTREKAQEKAKEVRKKAVSGETDAIKEAAGKALATFFTSFNLNGVKGYSTEDLEALRFLLTDEIDFSNLQVKVEGFSSIFFHKLSRGELEQLLTGSENKLKRITALEGLALHYVNDGNTDLKKIKSLAKSQQRGSWMRRAAALAFGKMAVKKVKLEELLTLTRSSHIQLAKGAGIALKRQIIESDRTETEVLQIYEDLKQQSESLSYGLRGGLAHKLERPPEGVPDEYVLKEDSELGVKAPGVLANDWDPDGDELVANLLENPEHGALTLNEDGSFHYEPEGNYAGKDLFLYEVTDGALSSEVKVNLQIKQVNDPPTVKNDEVTLNIAESLSTSFYLFANDSDVEGQKMTVTSFGQPSEGRLEVDETTGRAIYTSNLRLGDFSTSYTVKDEGGLTNKGKIKIHVVYKVNQ